LASAEVRVLDAGGGEDVDLGEVVGAVVLGDPIRVAAVAVDVAQGSGDAAVGEEEHEGVDAFGRVDVDVPEHVCIGGVGHGMALVRAVEGRQFDGIAHEEDRLVVEDAVIVSCGRLELDGPSRGSLGWCLPIPRSGLAVEMRVRSSVFLPMPVRRCASVMSVMSWVTST
jgi:hypothetical protein